MDEVDVLLPVEFVSLPMEDPEVVTATVPFFRFPSVCPDEAPS